MISISMCLFRPSCFASYWRSVRPTCQCSARIGIRVRRHVAAPGQRRLINGLGSHNIIYTLKGWTWLKWLLTYAELIFSMQPLFIWPGRPAKLCGVLCWPSRSPQSCLHGLSTISCYRYCLWDPLEGQARHEPSWCADKFWTSVKPRDVEIKIRISISPEYFHQHANQIGQWVSPFVMEME